MDVRSFIQNDFLPFKSATDFKVDVLGTIIASPPGAAGSLATYTKSAPADCAKIGGASPVVPKSILPTLRPSSNCGPAVNSVHFTSTPNGTNRFSKAPVPLRIVNGPYFW